MKTVGVNDCCLGHDESVMSCVSSLWRSGNENAGSK